MTKSRVLAALAATVLAAGLFVSEAQSQGSATRQPCAAAEPTVAADRRADRRADRHAAAGPVALLDVSRVYKGHARFKGMMDDMKAYVQKVETWVKTRARRPSAPWPRQLKEYSARHARSTRTLETEVAKRQSNLQVQMQMQRKELMQQEAKIYHNVYSEIEQEVESVAAARGFVMVLRYNGDEVDRRGPGRRAPRHQQVGDLVQPRRRHHRRSHGPNHQPLATVRQRGHRQHARIGQGIPAQPPRR